MSDFDGSAAGTEPASNIDFNSLPDDPTYIPPEQQSESLASPFLAKIQDENERKIVEKYVRDWDSGVTRQFQKIHESYKPYKDLGVDPDSMRLAVNIMQTLDTNPQAVYEILHQQYGQQQQQQQFQPEEEEDNPYAGMTPQAAQEFQQMKQLVEMMAGQQIQQQQASQQYQEDAMLEQHLANLHAQHGEFDEDFILTKVLAGKTWDQALSEYTGLMGKLTGSVRRAPTVMGGEGAIPAGKIPPSKLKGDDLNKFVASQLAALQHD